LSGYLWANLIDKGAPMLTLRAPLVNEAKDSVLNLGAGLGGRFLEDTTSTTAQAES
jgi:hypothetical protein